MFRIKPIHIFIGLLIVLVVVWGFYSYRPSIFEGASSHKFVNEDGLSLSFDSSNGSVSINNNIVISRDGSIEGGNAKNVKRSSSSDSKAFVYENKDVGVIVVYIAEKQKDAYVVALNSDSYNILGYIAYVNGKQFDMNTENANIDGIIKLAESNDDARKTDVKSHKTSYGKKIEGSTNAYHMGNTLEAKLGTNNIKMMDSEEWAIKIFPDAEESLIILRSGYPDQSEYYVAFTLFMVNGEIYVDPVLIHKRTPEETSEEEPEEEEEPQDEEPQECANPGAIDKASSKIIDFWKSQMNTNDYIKKTQVVPLSCQTCPSQCAKTASQPAAQPSSTQPSSSQPSGPLSNFANNTVNTAGGVANNAINTTGGIAAAGLLGAGLLGAGTVGTVGNVANKTVDTAGNTVTKVTDSAGNVVTKVTDSAGNVVGKVADAAGGVAKSALGTVGSLGLGAGMLGASAIGTTGNVLNNAVDKTTGLLKPGSQNFGQQGQQQGQLQYNQQGQLVMSQQGGQQVGQRTIPMPGYQFAFPPVSQYPGMQQSPIQTSDFMPVTADFSKFAH